MYKILIVDDDKDILEPIALLLEDEGYQVLTSTKGEQIIQLVEKFAPDVILLDVLMSGSDGREICKKLKKSETMRKIPIIMMSAHPTARHDSAGCGADDFIAKPFDVAELLAVIAKYMPA